MAQFDEFLVTAREGANRAANRRAQSVLVRAAQEISFRRAKLAESAGEPGRLAKHLR
jgi:hypothetical protein